MSIGSFKAKAVLEDLEISSHTDLQYLTEICMARGVFVREDNIDGAEARLTISRGTGDTKAVIVVKPNDSYETRTRFSVAHELGHFEIHKDIQSTISCNDRALNEWFGKQDHQKRETDANEFASELLLPAKFIAPDFNASKPSLNLIEELADKYQCSFLAVARRLIELSQDACALVFYRGDQILYHILSKRFKEQNYWIAPGKLDSQTFAFDAAMERKFGRGMSMVDAAAWIDTSDMKEWQAKKLKDKNVLEQARYFSRLDLGVSLVQLTPTLIWN
ncbi:MAG: ImmA/IrrE family metallo-endopeptidase [Bdellovibrionales bacterium]